MGNVLARRGLAACALVVLAACGSAVAPSAPAAVAPSPSPTPFTLPISHVSSWGTLILRRSLEYRLRLRIGSDILTSPDGISRVVIDATGVRFV
jgi:hypothetical protein